MQRPLRCPSILLLPHPLLRLHSGLPLGLVLSQYQPAPTFLLPLGSARLRIRDGELASSKVILEVLLQMDYLFARLGGGGDGGAEQSGVAAARAEAFARVFADSAGVSLQDEISYQLT